MCIKIKSEVIIANYFAECNDEEELKLSRLIEIKNQIEERFKEKGRFVIIDVSRGSISTAIYSNPNYFSFDYLNSVIKFIPKNRNGFYEDVYSLFNAKLDPSIKFDFLLELEKILDQYSTVKVS